MSEDVIYLKRKERNNKEIMQNNELVHSTTKTQFPSEIESFSLFHILLQWYDGLAFIEHRKCAGTRHSSIDRPGFCSMSLKYLS